MYIFMQNIYVCIHGHTELGPEHKIKYLCKNKFTSESLKS